MRLSRFQRIFLDCTLSTLSSHIHHTRHTVAHGSQIFSVSLCVRLPDSIRSVFLKKLILEDMRSFYARSISIMCRSGLELSFRFCHRKLLVEFTHEVIEGVRLSSPVHLTIKRGSIYRPVSISASSASTPLNILDVLVRICDRVVLHHRAWFA